MPSGVPQLLALPNDELPEITDAGVGLTLLMVSSLMADRERSALTARIADAVEAQDWTAMAALTRRLAAVPGAVCRMADVARAGIERYDAGMGCPDDGPAAAARARRSLVRTANWLDRRFWPMYGTVRAKLPPASEGMAAPVAASPTCADITTHGLDGIDRRLDQLQGDIRPTSLTARRLAIADRNAKAAACRDCGRCRVSREAITEPMPLL